MSVAECTPEDLAAHVAETPAFVLDIWADWCPNCRVLNGMLERMAPDYTGRIAFKRLNHGTYPEVGEKQGVRSLPALLFYRDGKIVDIHQGFIAAPALRERLRALCEPPR